ncbi:hypothetical protein [Beijerinckia indica]|uniref:MltA-interacting MipA family protein n=1 Tax=Beijerinckia indica subsp. indica (strain ATCC 9039 / DSM 1715 / NCIMB 8712) TaxID=395963 RepID=B2IK37_BEII9|nr:hypothetical protein [Beijerinckia indica]ACB94969.1 conserved hypothetical protein [Beijerinckia indica subsp. indica ATCC 9039]
MFPLDEQPPFQMKAHDEAATEAPFSPGGWSFLISASVLGLAALAPFWGSAWAGAFLLPPGAGQVIGGMTFSGSSRAFDAHGRVIPVPSYRKFELGTYLEYGLHERVTLVASPSYDHIRSGKPGFTYDGLGQSMIGARIGLLRSDWDILSFETSLLSPSPPFTQGAALIQARRAAGADLHLAAAHGFKLEAVPVFLEAAFGYRFFGHAQPGEWHVDLTVGGRPIPRLLALIQNFSTIFSNQTKVWPRQSWHKFQISLVYDLTSQWSVQGGSFITVAGTNAGREFGPLLALWYRF